jgi:spermidine/putrescine transport system substrate-binding protein
MLTEMRDTIGLVMLGEGKDPTKATVADAKAAAAKIKKARESGQIRKFTGNDYAEDLAAGNIAVALAWSGDIQGLAADNPNLRWIAPKEGAMLYSDNMMIPKTDDRQDLAMAWINYVYDPKHSAQIVAGAPYLSGAKGTGAELAKIAPDLAKSPLVNPPDDLRARLHVFRALTDAEDTEFNRIFQDAIGA